MVFLNRSVDVAVVGLNAILSLNYFTNSRNGRWRSEWSFSFQGSGSAATVTGVLKVQVKK